MRQPFDRGVLAGLLLLLSPFPLAGSVLLGNAVLGPDPGWWPAFGWGIATAGLWGEVVWIAAGPEHRIRRFWPRRTKEVDGGRYTHGSNLSGPWLEFDDPPSPRPPWWRPFARRRWQEERQLQNLMLVAWYDWQVSRRELRLEDIDRVKSLMAEREETP